MAEKTSFDIIVIGTGSMGSAACYYAAKSGARVLGLDADTPPHNMGSHAGHSRIVRMAYFEHPDYVPLLQRAYKCWEELEHESKFRLFHKTGLSYFGHKDSQLIEGVKLSAGKYNIPLETRLLSSTLLSPPHNMVHIHEPNAGYVDAHNVISKLITLSKLNGARILSNTPVIRWRKSDKNIVVVTENTEYTTEKLIITAGAWSSVLIPKLDTHLKVTKQSLFWIEPKNRNDFLSSNFPCWNIQDPKYPGLFYGFPLANYEGQPLIKIAHHAPGQPIDPKSNNRTATLSDQNTMRYVLDMYFSGKCKKIVHSQTCLYTNSTDENFIVDYLDPDDKRIVFSTGFSGHGFKFSPMIGETLVEMVDKGNTNMPISFLAKRRLL